MEGDPVIDRLMRPVMATIEQHVKNQAAIFHIYNRAYEAVMNGVTVIDVMREQLSKSNAEIERLRKALEDIIFECDINGLGSFTVRSINSIAQEALKGGEE